MTQVADPEPARAVCFGELLMRLSPPADELLLQPRLLVGASWLHLSGIDLAVSPAAAGASLLAVRAARELGAASRPGAVVR